MLGRLQNLNNGRVLFHVTEIAPDAPDRYAILAHDKKIAEIVNKIEKGFGKIIYFIKFDDGFLLQILHEKI